MNENTSFGRNYLLMVSVASIAFAKVVVHSALLYREDRACLAKRARCESTIVAVLPCRLTATEMRNETTKATV